MPEYTKMGTFLRTLGASLNPEVAQQFSDEARLDQQQQQFDVTRQDRSAEAQASRKEKLAAFLGTSLAKIDRTDPRNAQTVASLEAGIDKLGEEYAPYKSVGAPSATKDLKPNRFKGVWKGQPVIAWSEGTDTIMQHPTTGEKITNPVGLTERVTGTTEQDPYILTKKTQSDIQEQLLKTGQAKDRLKVIKEGFKPKFTQLGTKASTKFTAFTEKLGFSPSRANKRELKEFTAFARNSLGNINQHIRDRTGAVMNKDEIPRLMAEMPNLGTGLLDGDSATQFSSKIDGVVDSLQAAEDRLLFAQANGLGVDPEVFTRKLPLQDFIGLPRNPGQFDETKWNKMLPSQRKRLVELLKERNK